MPRDADPDDELVDLLADLERTLTDLRTTLGPETDRRRPPTPGEILRFTERYTLPTAIALLEATVRSLELLRALLRLADPERSGVPDASREREGAPDATDLRTALADLQSALTRPDLPDDSEVGSILDEARNLTAEIDDRLDAERERTAEQPSDQGGIEIDVTEEDVDVDAELESIRESIEEDEDEDET